MLVAGAGRPDGETGAGAPRAHPGGGVRAPSTSRPTVGDRGSGPRGRIPGARPHAGGLPGRRRGPAARPAACARGSSHRRGGARSQRPRPQAQVVVLAAPPLANLSLLRAPRPAPAARSRDHRRRERQGADLSPRPGASASRASSGGHPMAGTERSGFAASSPRPLPRPSLDPHALGRRASRGARRSLPRSCRGRARPLVMPAADHDRAVAFLSHAPQIVSWAILAAALGDPVARRHLRMARARDSTT